MVLEQVCQKIFLIEWCCLELYNRRGTNNIVENMSKPLRMINILHVMK
jgi:hypothetical protein